MIVMGVMDVAVENGALVENVLKYSSVFYFCLSSNVQFLPLIVSTFYIPTLHGPKRLSNLQLNPL